MRSLRLWETAGFLVIAAALHVSAAAVLLPEQVRQGAPVAAPPAALAAGSAQIEDLVAEWDAPPSPEPETSALTAPAPEDMTAPPLSDQQPEPTVIAPPPALAAPDPATLRPNLPPPPEPQPRIVPPDLPELQAFSPPRITAEPALRLEASARPAQRPEKPEPRRQTRPRAEPQDQRQPAARQQPAERRQAGTPTRAGQGGQSANSRAGGGGGGLSANQRASLQAQWQAQISTCLLRSIARTSGGSGLRATLAVQVGRNGRIQAAQITGSTGNARIDREIARGARRARCPAAPAQLTNASFAFTQPISIR